MIKNIGGLFLMLGIIVTALHYWRKKDQTVNEALVEVYKDMAFASNKGIERNSK